MDNLATPVTLLCGNIPVVTGSWELVDSKGALLAHIPLNNGENYVSLLLAA